MAGRGIGKTVWTVAVAIGTGLVVSGSALCAPSEGMKRGEGPPQEMVDACKGRAVGDAVQVTIQGGRTVSGICRQIDGTLVMIPKPPQAAIDACKGRAEGDSAQMKRPNGETVNGTCRMVDGKLTLMPADAMGARNGGQHR